MKKLLSIFMAVTVSVNGLKADILDLYMMGVLPSIVANYEGPIEPIKIPVISDDPAVNTASFNETMVLFANGLKKHMDNNFEIIRIATDDFNSTLDESEISITEVRNAHEKITENLSNLASLMLYANYLNEVQATLPSSGSSAEVQPRAIISGLATVGLFVSIGVISAGIGIYKAAKEYGNIGANTIVNADGKELEDINLALNLPLNSSNEEALGEFNSRGFVKQAGLAMHEIATANGGDTVVQVRSNFATLSNKILQEGIKLNMSTNITASKGELLKLVPLAGAASNAATFVKLGVDIASLEPVDKVVMSLKSDIKTNQTIPSSAKSYEEAMQTLEKLRLRDETVEIDDAIESATKITNEIARNVSNAIINPDGSVDVLIPDWFDLKILDRLSDGDVLEIREILSDAFDLLVVSEDMQPLQDVNLSINVDTNLTLDPHPINLCPMLSPNGNGDTIYLGGDWWDDNYTRCMYYDSGALASESPHVNGLGNGHWLSFWETGDFASKGYIKDGLSHLYSITYWDSGGFMHLKYYWNGLEDGQWLSYTRDGLNQQEINYHLGILHGLWIDYYIYDPRNLPKRIREYDMGDLISDCYYNADGQLNYCTEL